MTSTEEEVQMNLLKKENGVNGNHVNGNGKLNGKSNGNGHHVEQEDVEQDLQDEILLNASQPKAPDGGWGWMVVLGAFMCNFVVDGIMFAFDIMRKAFSDEFPGVQEYEIQIMGSLIPGLYLSLAPFASVLLNLYGPRPLVIAGGILGAFAFFVSAWVKSFYVLMFLYGVVGGVAFTLIYSPSILAVGFYFDRKRATATGITVCGSCVGTFALSTLMQILEKYYGSWRGVLVICAGVVLNCCVFGALFRPLPELVLEQLVVTQDEQCVVDGGDGTAAPTDDQQQQFIIQKIIEEKRRQRAISRGSLDNCVITKDNRVVKIDAQSQMSLSKQQQQPGSGRQSAQGGHIDLTAASPGNFAVTSPTPSAGYDGVPRTTSQTKVHSYLHVSRQSLHQSRTSMRSPGLTVQQVGLGSGILYRQDAYYTGNVQNTKQYRDAQAVAAATGADADQVYAQSVTNIPADLAREGDLDDLDGIGIEGEKEATYCCGLIKAKPVKDALTATFDMTLLSSPTFLILCMAAFLGMLGFFTPFFFGLSYGVASGMTPEEGLWVINSIAISNAVGRVGCGVLSDQPWADSLFITNVAMILSGAINIILPFFASYGPIVFYIYAVAIGLAISPFISLRSIIVVDLLGLEKLTAAYGFLLLFMGIAAFVGGPVLVGIKGATSFAWVFYISGGVLALSGIICLPCRTFAKWEKERAERKALQEQAEEVGTPLNTPDEQTNGGLVANGNGHV